MRFVTYGPFDMPRRNGLIDNDNDAKDLFWQLVDQSDPGLADAVGCYVFSIRSGGGALPWYVGKTERAFRTECFQAHKLVHYNEALAERSGGTPWLFLIPKLTPMAKFAKGNGGGAHDIDFIEDYLISRSLIRNDRLKNKRSTKLYRELQFQGFINSDPGHPGLSAIELRNVLGGT